MSVKSKIDIKNYLRNFIHEDINYFDLFPIIRDTTNKTQEDIFFIQNTIGNNYKINRFINEFWTSKQRQVSSIHEISYRGCFKAQLPSFFINLLTKEQDIVYDPFSGRGTTAIASGLLNRNVISNDINPLSEILCYPRFFIPTLKEIKDRLYQIEIDYKAKAEIDLSMFYHKKTEAEIVSIRSYLNNRKKKSEEDNIDKWIRMIATNRLTGHSKGFFSVYTLPPNQAVSRERQIKINKQRNQVPEYRDVRKIILDKSKSLIRDITEEQKNILKNIGKRALFINKDARETPEIDNDTVQLTVTSPPFLDVIDYSNDNWLRCWFNFIDSQEVSSKITVLKKLEEWLDFIRKVFLELFRITKKEGWVAFEVGEIRKGKIQLDEYIVPIGIEAGFICEGILINKQNFTKTSNIWGISNNSIGTNTNRIVLFRKE